MFGKLFRENLRRLDVRCAQRARWLGVHKLAERSSMEAAEVRRRLYDTGWIQLPVEKFSTSALLCEERVRRIMETNQR